MSSRPVYRYRCAGAFEGRIQGTVPRGWSDAGVEKCGSGARGGDATRSKGASCRSDAIVRFMTLRNVYVFTDEEGELGRGDEGSGPRLGQECIGRAG